VEIDITWTTQTTLDSKPPLLWACGPLVGRLGTNLTLSGLTSDSSSCLDYNMAINTIW